MIQRPQTLLLLLSVIIMSITAFSPIWSLELDGKTVILDAMNIQYNETTTSVIYLAIISLGSAAIGLFTIFQYQKRQLQMILCSLNKIIITSFLLVTAFVAIPKATELAGLQGAGTFNWTFYLPIVAIIANLIAGRLIKKDEELVRSMDRMR